MLILNIYLHKQPGVITGYKRVESKTLYDPKVFTDNQIVDMSQKAAALGYKEAVNLYKSSNGRMNQYESTYNGIQFRSYIEKMIMVSYFSNVHVVK
jgi:filamentous hemagglutinin